MHRETEHNLVNDAVRVLVAPLSVIWFVFILSNFITTGSHTNIETVAFGLILIPISILAGIGSSTVIVLMLTFTVILFYTLGAVFLGSCKSIYQILYSTYQQYQ
jgi:hypothetical protein